MRRQALGGNALASRAFLAEHHEALAAWWLSAKGVAQNGCAGVLSLTMGSVSERYSGFGDEAWALQVDLSGAFRAE